MKCDGTRMHENCQNEATTEITMLHGNVVHLCDRCAKYIQICSEIWEPIDREIIKNLQELSQ
jgi:ketopantoate reductase